MQLRQDHGILSPIAIPQGEQTDRSCDQGQDECQHKGNGTKDADSSSKIGCERHLGRWIPIEPESPPRHQ